MLFFFLHNRCILQGCFCTLAAKVPGCSPAASMLFLKICEREGQGFKVCYVKYATELLVCFRTAAVCPQSQKKKYVSLSHLPSDLWRLTSYCLYLPFVLSLAAYENITLGYSPRRGCIPPHGSFRRHLHAPQSQRRELHMWAGLNCAPSKIEKCTMK